ncbi:hypothetical protein GQ54DRAFT_178001 [Martensiomyces pterosporus]|nr:hypothetical protein GQ54DRAFT_178001 [Martensiomyces pterosporus]
MQHGGALHNRTKGGNWAFDCGLRDRPAAVGGAEKGWFTLISSSFGQQSADASTACACGHWRTWQSQTRERAFWRKDANLHANAQASSEKESTLLTPQRTSPEGGRGAVGCVRCLKSNATKRPKWAVEIHMCSARHKRGRRHLHTLRSATKIDSEPFILGKSEGCPWKGHSYSARPVFSGSTGSNVTRAWVVSDIHSSINAAEAAFDNSGRDRGEERRGEERRGASACACARAHACACACACAEGWAERVTSKASNNRVR